MVLLGLLGFSRCNSQRLLLDMPPFEVGEVKYSSGVSGIESEDTGDYLFVQVVLKEGILLDSVYFRGKKSKMEYFSNQDKWSLYRAKFYKTPFHEKEIVMHADPAKEARNTLLDGVSDVPFDLRPNEAIVSFVKNTKLFYFKIENITESSLEEQR